MGRFWLLVSVSLLLMVGCSADEWQTVRGGGEEGFLVAVPQDAREQPAEGAQIAAAGEQFLLASVAYAQGGTTYVVGQASLADDIEGAEAIDTFLDDMQYWLVADSGYYPRHPAISNLSWNGYPGREFRFRIGEEGPATAGRARIMLVEEEVYLLLMTGPEEVVDEKAATFLASFDTQED